MTPFDDPSNPQLPPEPEESQSSLDDLASRIVVRPPQKLSRLILPPLSLLRRRRFRRTFIFLGRGRNCTSGGPGCIFLSLQFSPWEAWW
jgi:hypothetical protein